MKKEIPEGKVPFEILEKIFSLLPPFPPQVKVKPGIGKDFTAIERENTYLILKTDPITLTGKEIGWYLVNINANDIVTSGARPLWLLVSVLLPRGTSEKDIEELVKELTNACEKLGISLCGGHTEITSAVNTPLLCGFMVGEVEKDKLLSPEKIEVGDEIVITKGIAIEGTSIIAREKEDELIKVFPKEFIERCKKFLYAPGISVVKEALIVKELGVKALHDPTEGGINTALYELGISGGKGVEVEKEKIPIYEETRILAEHFGLNPFGLIASGALLIVCSPEKTKEILFSLRREGIFAERIGKVIEEGFYYITPQGKEEIIPSPRDEVIKIFNEVLE